MFDDYKYALDLIATHGNQTDIPNHIAVMLILARGLVRREEQIRKGVNE